MCLTLAAFLAALPAAADPLLGPEAGLVSAVAAVHDELAPQTQTALTRAAHVDRQTVGEVRVEPPPICVEHGWPSLKPGSVPLQSKGEHYSKLC